MAQYALPSSTVSNDGAFSPSDGTSLHQVTDEGFGAGRGTGAGPDGNTVVGTIDASPGHTYEVALSAVTDPAVSTGHVLRYRTAKSSTGGEDAIITVDLMQGATPITSGAIFLNPLADSATQTTYTYTLSGAEADAITDYSALSVRVTVVKTGSGPNRTTRDDTIELEVPDAAPAVANPPEQGFARGLGASY